MRRLYEPVYAAEARANGRERARRAAPVAARRSLREHGVAPLRRRPGARRRARPGRSPKHGVASSRRSPPAQGRAIRLAEAVTAYEALQDLIGRVMSYASLLYASDTSDTARAKFYGDAQEKVTALAGDLLFFELELNRLDDAVLEAAMATPSARPLPSVAGGHPQGEAAPARRRHRAGVPRKIRLGRRRVEPPVRRHDVGAAIRRRGREP